MKQSKHMEKGEKHKKQEKKSKKDGMSHVSEKRIKEYGKKKKWLLNIVVITESTKENY